MSVVTICAIQTDLGYMKLTTLTKERCPLVFGKKQLI